MNKLKTLLLTSSLLLGIISEPLSAASFVAVSNGVTISASPVIIGKNFSIDFSLKETKGQAKTFDDVSIAILDPTNKFIFDFKLYGKVTINANTTKAFTATNVINTGRPAGSYKAVIRGKLAGSWLDLTATGTGVTPKAFAVGQAIQPPPPPLAPTLKTPVDKPASKLPKTGVNFSWDASARATSYRLVISQNSSFSGFNPTTFACDGTCGTTPVTGTSQTRDMSLDATTYYWKVNASNATGTSPWSVVRSFATAGVPVSPLSAKVDTFVAKWTNNKVDFDNVYGDYAYQCVDLMHRYAQDVLGLNGYLPTGNAYNVYLKATNTATNNKFTKIPNTPTGVPKKGDIIFWSGDIGHVAIFLSGDATSFTSFDQNWPLKTAPHKETHNYNGVVGWLHPNL